MAQSSTSHNPDPAHALDEDVRAFLAGRLRPHDRIVVGLSGGLDSIVLAHLLSRLAPELDAESSALYVHHGLSANADRWLEFCASACCRMNIGFTAIRVAVDPDGVGVEAAARDARYRAFHTHCTALAGNHSCWLALAHHRGDQAETVLFNLLRGSGVAGLAAMSQERPFAPGVTLIRPLLHQPREALAAYAAAWDLDWVEDESNLDTRFARNFLRRDILPRLRSFFPGAEKTLSRCSEHCAQAAGLLDELAMIDRQTAARTGQPIHIDALASLSSARLSNLIRHELHSQGQLPPPTGRLEEIVRQLRTAGPHSRLSITVGRLTLRVWRGLLYLVEKPVAPPAMIRWAGETTVPWGSGVIHCRVGRGAGIAASLLHGEVRFTSIANHLPGPIQLRLAKNRPTRRLKQLLQEAGIPPWQRPSLPLLYVGERLLWIGKVGADAASACPPDEPGFLFEYDEENDCQPAKRS